MHPCQSQQRRDYLSLPHLNMWFKLVSLLPVVHALVCRLLHKNNLSQQRNKHSLLLRSFVTVRIRTCGAIGQFRRLCGSQHAHTSVTNCSISKMRFRICTYRNGFVIRGLVVALMKKNRCRNTFSSRAAVSNCYEKKICNFLLHVSAVLSSVGIR